MEARSRYVLLPKRETRSGLRIDEFTKFIPCKDLLAKLRRRGHTFIEYMNRENTGSKLYFDTERYYDHDPTPEEIAGYEGEIAETMSRLIIAVGHHVGVTVSYVIATRHGRIDVATWKLSFRFACISKHTGFKTHL